MRSSIRNTLLFSLLTVNVLCAQQFTRNHVREHGACGRYSEVSFSQSVQITTNLALDVQIEVSTRGNGALSVGNLRDLPIWKEEKIYYWYEDDMLAVTFIDLDSNGAMDLLISGIINYGGERDAEVYWRENVLFIYYYNIVKECFELEHRRSSYDLFQEGTRSWYDDFHDHSNPNYEEFRLKEREKAKRIEIGRGSNTVQRASQQQ